MRGALLPLLPVLCLLVFSVPAATSSRTSGGRTPEAGLAYTIDSTSTWAGYVAASGKDPSPVVTAVYGSWIVQAVVSSPTAQVSSQWVGIGGFFTGDTTLLQAGTTSDTFAGATNYSAWWEAVPAPPTILPNFVSPGDRIQASLVCVSACTSAEQGWKLTLRDLSQHWTFTTQLTYSSKEKSADWIEERPNSCLTSSTCRMTSLADFNTAAFGQDYTKAGGGDTATIGGATLPIGSLPFAAVTMVGNPGSAILAKPSALTADGTSFTVRWRGT